MNHAALRHQRQTHSYDGLNECLIHLDCSYVTYLHHTSGITTRKQLYRCYITYLGEIRRR